MKNDSLEISEYLQAVKNIIEISSEINKVKKFPVFGICLGFEAMFIVLTDYKIKRDYSPKSTYYLGKVNWEVSKNEFWKTIFNEEDIKEMRDNSITIFNHKYSFKKSTLVKSKELCNNLFLDAFYVDAEQNELLAAFSHKTLPFYAVQYHPEKGQFLNVDFLNITKTHSMIRIGRLHSLVLSNLIKKSEDKFSYKDLIALKKDYVYKMETDTMYSYFYRQRLYKKEINDLNINAMMY